jgi:hypothetical protein
VTYASNHGTVGDMPTPPLPEKSPFLAGVFQTVLADKHWTARDLQRKANVGYNWARWAIDGKVIPSRNALSLMCTAAGLDFAVVWSHLHSKELRDKTDEQARAMGVQIARTATLDAKYSHMFPPEQQEQQTADGDRLLPELAAVFAALPSAARYELMSTAWRLANDHGVKVAGFER